MTPIEFRMFFDSLPDTSELGGGGIPPGKRAFAKECGVTFPTLQDIASGKKALSVAVAHKLLPVMRKYGFPE